MKEIKWQPLGDDDFCGSIAEDTDYMIWQEVEGDPVVLSLFRGEFETILSIHGSVDEAKQAAQKHFSYCVAKDFF